jgi:hypothetical protein
VTAQIWIIGRGANPQFVEFWIAAQNAKVIVHEDGCPRQTDDQLSRIF